MLGVAAGAILTGASRRAAAGCIRSTCATDRGLPPLLLIASWRLSNVGGGAGGAIFATTARVCSDEGGLVAGAPVPRTACFSGTTAGVKALTGALATSRRSILTAFLETGWAEVNAWGVVAATAPGTLWFTYLTFVTFTLLCTTVVL